MFQAHKLKYILKIYSLREDKAMTGNIINRADAALTGKTVLKKLGIRKLEMPALMSKQAGKRRCLTVLVKADLKRQIYSKQ